MPYQTNIPNASQSPGLFPAQCNDNFTRLKTIISANHKFNDSAATDDGYHQIIKTLPTASADVPNDATVGQSFVNSADATMQLWHKDALNRLFQITPTIPIYAAVNFNGSNPVSYRFRHNVSTVTRISQGVYVINFTTNLPSVNYVVTGVGMRNQTGGCDVEVYPNATYGDSVKVNSVKIRTLSASGDERDMIGVFVMCCGG